MDIKDIASFTDYFVIYNGTNDRILDALAKGVLEVTKKEYKKKSRVTGEANEGWLVLDYGDVVVHLFSPDQHEHYDLEELWNGRIDDFLEHKQTLRAADARREARAAP